MKKLSVILLLIFSVSFAYSQAGTEINFDQLKKKVEKSNADIQNPKKNIKEGTWMDRAELMMEIYDSQVYNFFTVSNDMSSFKFILGKQLKNTVQEELEGVLFDKFITERTIFYFSNNVLVKWEILNPIVDKPLDIAFESLKKVQEIDAQGKKSNKVKEQYNSLVLKYKREGLNCYSLKNNEGAYTCFLKVLEIDQLPVVNVKDTVFLYYTALAAQYAGKNQEAIDYYKKALELDYSSEGNAYANIDLAFKALGDKESGLPYLEQGFIKHPKNQTILIPLINYYLNKNEDASKVITYIDKAIEDDPKNASLYFAKGTIYDKQKEVDNAFVAYNKAIEYDPKYFDAYYNLGALIYNKGVKFLEEANKVPAKEIEKYDALIQNANNEFKKSIPIFEMGLQIMPNDRSTLETLKNIYFRYRNESDDMNKKYLDYNEKFQNLK